MKYWITILFLIFITCPAKADYITTQTFVINAAASIIVNISGNLTSGISAEDGTLGNSLSINFNVLSNTAYNNATLRAFVVDSANVKHSAFSGTDHGYVQSESVFVTMANTDDKPNATSINSCKSDASLSTDNPNTITYSGTVTIDGNGKLRYRNSTDNDYVELRFVANQSTNLALTLNRAPKAGTFDAETSLDEPGPYQVEIYMDNLP